MIGALTSSCGSNIKAGVITIGDGNIIDSNCVIIAGSSDNTVTSNVSDKSSNRVIIASNHVISDGNIMALF